MKPIELGGCCPACFDAINFNTREMQAHQIAPARAAAVNLSTMAEREGAYSLHTEGEQYYSKESCVGCGNTLSGPRWKLVGLVEKRRDIA
jgi:hypothetical protein